MVVATASCVASQSTEPSLFFLISSSEGAQNVVVAVENVNEDNPNTTDVLRFNKVERKERCKRRDDAMVAELQV
jgi:hypothetical protein